MRIVSLVAGTLVAAAAAPALADVANGGFELGSGGAPSNWTAEGNGQSVTSLSGISPPAGSWMAYADTSSTGQNVHSGLTSDAFVVGAATLTFVADFFTNEATPDATFNDSFVLTIRSTGAGAPADTNVIIGDTFSTFVGSGGGFNNHTGFQNFTVNVASRIGFSTTLEFFVLDAADGTTDSAFLLDSVVNPEPGTIALFALGGLGLGGVVLRRRARASSPRRA